MKRWMTLCAAPALAAFLAACQADSSDGSPKIASPALEDYRSPDEVRFLSDDEGNVMRQVPLAILQDVRGQLLAQGQTGLLKDLEARYDFATGEVKDPRAAERAELYLKSQLAANPPATSGTPAGDGEVLSPEDLPPGIRITDDMVEGLRKAAAKVGAQ